MSGLFASVIPYQIVRALFAASGSADSREPRWPMRGLHRGKHTERRKRSDVTAYWSHELTWLAAARSCHAVTVRRSLEDRSDSVARRVTAS